MKKPRNFSHTNLFNYFEINIATRENLLLNITCHAIPYYIVIRKLLLVFFFIVRNLHSSCHAQMQRETNMRNITKVKEKFL